METQTPNLGDGTVDFLVLIPKHTVKTCALKPQFPVAPQETIAVPSLVVSTPLASLPRIFSHSPALDTMSMAGGKRTVPDSADNYLAEETSDFNNTTFKKVKRIYRTLAHMAIILALASPPSQLRS